MCLLQYLHAVAIKVLDVSNVNPGGHLANRTCNGSAWAGSARSLINIKGWWRWRWWRRRETLSSSAGWEEHSLHATRHAASRIADST